MSALVLAWLVIGAAPPCLADVVLPEGVVARLGAGPHPGRVRMRSNVTLSPDGRWAAWTLQGGLFLSDPSGRVQTPPPGERGLIPACWDAAVAPGGMRVLGTIGPIEDKKTSWPIQALKPAGWKWGEELATDQGIQTLSASFSGDGRRAAVAVLADDTAAVRVWQFDPCKPLCRVELRGDAAGCALSADGRTLAAWVPEGGHVLLHDVAADKPLRRIDAEGVAHASLAPDGKTLALARKGAKPHLTVRGADGRRLHDLPLPKAAVALCFSHDGALVASGEASGTIHVLDLASVRMTAIPPTGPVTLTALAFREGRLVAAGWRGDEPRVWFPRAGAAKEPAGHTAPILSLTFTPDGCGLVTAGADGARVWDIAGGGELRHVPHPAKRGLRRAALAPGGRHMLAWEEEGGEITLIDLADGKPAGRAASSLMRLGWRGSLSHRPFCFTADGARLLTLDAKNTHLVLRAVPGLKPVASFPTPLVPLGLSISPDGALAAVWEQYLENPLDEPPSPGVIVALPGGGRVRDLSAPGGYLGSAWSADGRTLACSAWGGVFLLDRRSGKSQKLDALANMCSTMAFSPDGRLLAVIDHSDRLTVIELATDTARLSMEAGSLHTLAFSPCGGRLASVAWGTAFIWDLTGREWPRHATRPPSAADWAALASRKSADAWPAMTRLVCCPAEAMALLRKRLRPAPGEGIDDDALRRHIAALGHDDFETRERALSALSRCQTSRLEAAMEKESDLEIRSRLARLLERIPRPTGDALRSIRTVEVLERMRTPEARRLLRELAGGNPDARLTAEAKAALSRLEAR